MISTNAWGIFPLSGIMGNNNATQDETAGLFPNITGVIPALSFKHPGTGIFNAQLAQTAWQLIGSGINESAEFIWDVQGQYRFGVWDVGADQLASGVDSQRPDGIPMAIYGAVPFNTNLPLFISGVYPNGQMTLWIGTYADPTQLNNGTDPTTGLPTPPFTLFTFGSASGLTGFRSSLNFVMLPSVSGQFNGGPASIPLVLQGYDNPPHASMPLWIGTYYELEDLLQPFVPFGSPQGTGLPYTLPLWITGSTAGGLPINDSFPLWMFGITDATGTSLPLVFAGAFGPSFLNTPTISGLPLYMTGIGGGVIPPGSGNSSDYPGVATLFIGGAYAIFDGSMHLFVCNSGLIVPFPLYVGGGGYGDPYFIGTNGALPAFATMPLFMNRLANIAENRFDLAIAGGTIPSGSLPLFMATAVSGQTNFIPMYLSSNTKNNALKTYISGW